MKKARERPLIAVNIIRMRKAKGWSQLVLAEKANLHVNVIKKIETGKSQGWRKTKERIAKAFNCTVDDLTQKTEVITWLNLPPDQQAELMNQLQKVLLKRLNIAARKRNYGKKPKKP